MSSGSLRNSVFVTVFQKLTSFSRFICCSCGSLVVFKALNSVLFCGLRVFAWCSTVSCFERWGLSAALCVCDPYFGVRRRCVLVTPILEFDLVGFSSWSSCCLLFLAYVSLFVSGGSSFVVTYVWFSQDL